VVWETGVGQVIRTGNVADWYRRVQSLVISYLQSPLTSTKGDFDTWSNGSDRGLVNWLKLLVTAGANIAVLEAHE
jgi:hypothetical protein